MNQTNFEKLLHKVADRDPNATILLVRISKRLNDELPKPWMPKDLLWYVLKLNELDIRGMFMWQLYLKCEQSLERFMAVLVATQDPKHNWFPKSDGDKNIIEVLKVGSFEGLPNTKDLLRKVETRFK